MTKFHQDWHSQAGQDKWVVELFKEKRGGYFLDIGAFDGIGDDNTYLLEKKYGWKGICVEPNPDIYKQCKINRPNSICLDIALWNEAAILSWNPKTWGTKKDGPGTLVPSLTFKEIFKKYKVPNIIDYVSLDIDGAEFEALECWPWDTHIAIAWTLEHNKYLKSWPKVKQPLYDIMVKNGYVRVVEDVACLDSYGGAFEDWYLHKDYVHLNDGIDLSFIKTGN